MRVREDYRTLTGPEKAGILMLAIGEDHAAKLFALMDDEEIKEMSQTMSNLGTVHSSIIERLFVEFADQIWLNFVQLHPVINARTNGVITCR